MSEAFDSHAIVELFGHQRIAGRVSEQQLAGGTFLRVDVPETERAEAYTRYYGAGAIYALTPVTEEIARAAAEDSYVWVPVRKDVAALPAGDTEEDLAYDWKVP
jgi:hypothetical protein